MIRCVLENTPELIRVYPQRSLKDMREGPEREQMIGRAEWPEDDDIISSIEEANNILCVMGADGVDGRIVGVPRKSEFPVGEALFLFCYIRIITNARSEAIDESSISLVKSHFDEAARCVFLLMLIA